jgi:hypothetical protein
MNSQSNIKPSDLFGSKIEDLEKLFWFIKTHSEDQEKFMFWKEFKFEIKSSAELELPNYPKHLPIYKEKLIEILMPYVFTKINRGGWT